MTITQKLDTAFEHGAIAYVSECDVLVPIRDRMDFQVLDETGEVFVYFANRWLQVNPELIKFVRHH